MKSQNVGMMNFSLFLKNIYMQKMCLSYAKQTLSAKELIDNF